MLLQGRFWAEEGNVFFENGWNQPWYKAIVLVYAGYLNLPANLAGILANFLPLKFAPYASTTLALVIQTVPATLIVFSKSSWLQTRIVCWLTLLVIATPPVSAEVWLNTISSHSILALCVGIILGLEEANLTVVKSFILMLAPLSGPASWFLTPIFFVRAGYDRSWGRALQGSILLTGVLIQILLFFQPSYRELGVDPLFLGSIFFVKHVLVPFAGHDAAILLSRGIVSNPAQLLPTLTVVALGLLIAMIVLRNPRQSAAWFFISAVVVAALSYYGAYAKSGLVDPDSGIRYAFVPQVLFGLTFVSLAAASSGFSSWIVVCWILVIGLGDYFKPSPRYSIGPSWQSEVKQWEEDPSHQLLIWPTGWSMALRKHEP